MTGQERTFKSVAFTITTTKKVKDIYNLKKKEIEDTRIWKNVFTFMDWKN